MPWYRDRLSFSGAMLAAFGGASSLLAMTVQLFTELGPYQSLLANQIHHASKSVFLTDGQLERDGSGRESLVDFGQHTLKISPKTIQYVDKDDAG